MYKRQVAYLRAEEASNQYAGRQGLFVIRAAGDSAAITNAKGFNTEFRKGAVGNNSKAT